jgi:hypothetical protein
MLPVEVRLVPEVKVVVAATHVPVDEVVAVEDAAVPVAPVV